MSSDVPIGAAVYRDAMTRENGLPSVDWEASFDRLETLDEWRGFLDCWIADISESFFTPAGAVFEFNGVIAIAPNADRAEKLAVIADEVVHRLDTMLPPAPAINLAQAGEQWPIVVIEFPDYERYYDYAALISSAEGDRIASAGMCVRFGYPHILINAIPLQYRNSTLAHELVHLVMDPFDSPLWLEEGLAKILPEVIFRNSRSNIDRDLIYRHRSFWDRETIQGFWDGDFFGNPETSELAYSLAEIVITLLLENHDRDAIKAFIAEASYEDAGDAASSKHLEAPIADAIAAFLGKSEWTPIPGEFWFNKADEQNTDQVNDNQGDAERTDDNQGVTG